MRNRFRLTYRDRATGELRAEHVFAGPFLYWSYNTRLGRLLTRWILARRVLSRPVGWLARRRFSRFLIPALARRMGLPRSSARSDGSTFKCFNDFFIRDHGRPSRMDFGDPSTCVSPVDGKVLILRDLEPDLTFRVKRSLFNLGGLLGEEELARCFTGGTAVLCRLGLSDYHHFHFPISGVPAQARAVGTRLYAGGPYALGWLTSFYTENYRMVTLIDSDLCGRVAQVEIGAFTVGSIHQTYAAGRHAEKGDEKGYFALGGSTVVLVFMAGAVEIDADLGRNSAHELETRVRAGEPIGRVPAWRTAARRSEEVGTR